jgi:hypothetical protein
MKIILFILLNIGNVQLLSQTNVDTVYNVDITATPCPIVSFFSDERYPESNKYNSFGGGLFVRGMWHPGRLLSVGILTGYIFIASDILKDANNTSAQLTAIPVQIDLSMQKHELEVGVGLGSYLLISRIDNGMVASSVRSELAMTVFGSYFFTMSENIFIGPVLKVNYLPYRGVVSIIPSINLCFNICRY